MAETYNVYRDGVQIAEGVTGTTYTDTDVDSSTNYEYQVSAVNEHGESELSDPIEVTTEPEQVPDPPEDDETGEQSFESFSVQEEETGEQSLESLTVPQLKEKADNEGIEYPSNIRKADLIDLLGGE